MTFDMIAYSRLWRDRQGRFSGVDPLRRQQLAKRAQALSRAAMEKLIYSLPEAVAASGRQLWTRTRNLINAEKGEVRGSGEVALTNEMVYAHRRHEANRPGFEFHVDPARTAHWRDEIQPELRQEQLEISAAAIRDLLSRGL